MKVLKSTPFDFHCSHIMAYHFGLQLRGLQVIQDIHFPVKKSTRRQVSFFGSAEIRKRLSTVTAVVFFFLGLGVFPGLRGAGRYLLNEIRNAFYGIGSPLLEKMMANKEVLSVGAYLNKALTLSNWLIYFMILIMALCMIGFLYIKICRIFSQDTAPCIQMDLQQSNGDFGNSDNCSSRGCFPELDEGGYCHARQPV